MNLRIEEFLKWASVPIFFIAWSYPTSMEWWLLPCTLIIATIWLNVFQLCVLGLLLIYFYRYETSLMLFANEAFLCIGYFFKIDKYKKHQEILRLTLGSAFVSGLAGGQKYYTQDVLFSVSSVILMIIHFKYGH